MQVLLQYYGLPEQAYTTEQIVNALPLNSIVQFAHNKEEIAHVSDAPYNYGLFVIHSGRAQSYKFADFYQTLGERWVYAHSSAIQGNRWRKYTLT